MKLYLSSYKLGNEIKKLQEWTVKNKRVAYIPNALDGLKVDQKARKELIEGDIKSLEELGFAVEILDLKKYFGKKQALLERTKKLGMVFLVGGNVFVLRNAMKLSGFDELLQKELKNRKDFVYAGYSAACCVLSPTLKQYQEASDITDQPYANKKVVLEGVGLIPYSFMPHYNSEHEESEDIGKEIDYCIKNKIPFKAVKDGEVLLLELNKS